jgi:hypothetical protein
VIIVSESSAEATRRGRTGRYTPARSRSSVAHNDTPRHPDARPISVHTEERTRSHVRTNKPVPPAGLGSGMGPRAGHEGDGSPGSTGIPSSAQRLSRAGAGIKVVQRMRCSTLIPAPALLRDELADATGYPLPPPCPAVASRHTVCHYDRQPRSIAALYDTGLPQVEAHDHESSAVFHAGAAQIRLLPCRSVRLGCG